jgi:hypothetical protein
MQKNADNTKVAIRRYRQNKKRLILGNKIYHFIPKNNICMEWVDLEDVETVLNIKYNCCGNSKKPEFHLASETDVRRYQFGGV